MKSYEEMAQEVIKRKDAYETKQKKIHVVIYRYCIPAFCFALIFGLTFYVGHLINPSSPSPSVNASTVVTPTDSSPTPDSSIIPPIESTVTSPADSLPNSNTPSNNSSQNQSSKVPSENEIASEIVSKPKEDVIWIPELPKLDTPTLNGSSGDGNISVDIDPNYPCFDNYSDFENWIITGNPPEGTDPLQNLDKYYLRHWVNMWNNSDYTLQTGYYYKTKENNTLKLKYIDTYITESNLYRYYYRFDVPRTVECNPYRGYSFTLFMNNDDWVKEEFEKDKRDAAKEKRTYQKEVCNGVTYHVLIGNSNNEEFNFIGIYWQQDERWYYGYYLASKEDPDGYKNVIKDLYMVKTPFREDLKSE